MAAETNDNPGLKPSVTEAKLAQAEPDRSWTKGRITMAVVMGLAWLLVWCVLLHWFGRAHGLKQLFLRLDIYVPTATKVSMWIGDAAYGLAVPLSIALVAGMGVMLWRMKERVWTGYAVGALLTLVLLTVYVTVLLAAIPGTPVLVRPA